MPVSNIRIKNQPLVLCSSKLRFKLANKQIAPVLRTQSHSCVKDSRLAAADRDGSEIFAEAPAAPKRGAISGRPFSPPPTIVVHLPQGNRPCLALLCRCAHVALRNASLALPGLLSPPFCLLLLLAQPPPASPADKGFVSMMD